MLASLLRALRTAAIVVGCLLCFFFVIEVIQAQQVLYNLHPVLGTTFALLLGGAGATLLLWYIVSLRRRPVTLRPPPRRELDKAERRELRAYARYLRRVMRRLAQNDLLPDINRTALESEDGQLREALSDDAGHADLVEAVRHAEELRVQPAVALLDKLAEQEVRRCVRDVMLGVTLSPWRTVDLLVVMYRNARMVTRITGIYSNSPRLREHLLILRDVAAIVATVNFLNYGSRLMQNLVTSVPVLGRFSDDVAQGVGAGLLTSVAGHAALARCRAFRGWNEVEAQATLRNQLGVFMADIKKIVFDDMLPQLRKPVAALSPEAAGEPGWTDRLRDGVAAAIDETTAVMDSFVRQPVVAAGRGVARTGAALAERAIDGVRAGWKGTLTGVRKTGKAIGSGATRIGQGARGMAATTGRTTRRSVSAVAGKLRRNKGDNKNAPSPPSTTKITTDDVVVDGKSPDGKRGN
jgi:putative membrane protein